MWRAAHGSMRTGSRDGACTCFGAARRERALRQLAPLQLALRPGMQRFSPSATIRLVAM
tara:strand:- start:576 stop:752 length:177 start_codon:yes stop_codon:yes gene_type:complete